MEARSEMDFQAFGLGLKYIQSKGLKIHFLSSRLQQFYSLLIYYMKKIRQIDVIWFDGKFAERAEMIHLKFISARSDAILRAEMIHLNLISARSMLISRKIFIHFCPLKLIWRKKHEFHAQHSYSIAIGNTSLTCITFSLHAKKKNRENIHVHNCTTVQTLTEKMIRQINYLVISFVKCYFHEIVCQIWVRLRVNFRN